MTPEFINIGAAVFALVLGFITARATSRTETSSSYAALVAALETRLEHATEEMELVEDRLEKARTALTVRGERIAQLEARVRHLEDLVDRIPRDVLGQFGIDPDDFLGGLV